GSQRRAAGGASFRLPARALSAPRPPRRPRGVGHAMKGRNRRPMAATIASGRDAPPVTLETNSVRSPDPGVTMKLGSLKEGGRDGTLIVVSRDLQRAVRATGIAPTLQRALEDWSNLAPRLNALSDALNG